MYSVLPFKITTVAVVPDVLGRPCLVRGQESTNGTVKSSYKIINKDVSSPHCRIKNESKCVQNMQKHTETSPREPELENVIPD